MFRPYQPCSLKPPRLGHHGSGSSDCSGCLTVISFARQAGATVSRDTLSATRPWRRAPYGSRGSETLDRCALDRAEKTTSACRSPVAVVTEHYICVPSVAGTAGAVKHSGPGGRVRHMGAMSPIHRSQSARPAPAMSRSVLVKPRPLAWLTMPPRVVRAGVGSPEMRDTTGAWGLEPIAGAGGLHSPIGTGLPLR